MTLYYSNAYTFHYSILNYTYIIINVILYYLYVYSTLVNC